ncbi:MAG: serine hydrolase [Flavobacteriales bacterium]
MRSVLLSTLLLCALSAFAQSREAAEIDSLIDLAVAKKCFNGEVLVSIHNVPFHDRTVGFRDAATREPLKANSLFNIGSVSKPFTAVAVLQLQEKGLLNIKDRVVLHLPEFPYDSVRIEHLLSHTSGITPNLDFLDSTDDRQRLTNDSIIPLLKKYKVPLIFAPGSAWGYSNLGYDVLALLVERVSHISFDEYVQRNILAPAGMDRTFIPRTSALAAWMPKGLNAHDLVVPHMFADIAACEVVPTDSVGPFPRNDHYFVGSSNVYSTTGDLVKFDRALRDNVILDRVSQELAYTPFILTNGDTARDEQAPIPSYYGLGWFISTDTTGGRIIWHKGRSFGTRAILLRNPDKQQCVVALDNFDYTGCDLKGIACLRIINDRPYRNPILKSLVQVLGCGIRSSGSDAAVVEFNRLKENERQNYYISVDELIELSDELGNEGQPADALSVLELGKELFPASSEVYAAEGAVLLKTKHIEEGEQSFAKAAWLYGTTDEERETLLNYLGYRYILASNYGDAAMVLKLNTELYPLSCNTYDSYASALDLNGQLDLAILNQEKAVALASEQKHTLLPTLIKNLEALRAKKGK